MFTTGGRGARALARGRAILLLGAVLVIAACSGSANHPSPAPSPTPSPTQSAGGLGGTLHVVGSTDPAGLDPVAAASPQAAVLLRLTTRQLYTWTPSQFPATSRATASASASPLTGQTSGAPAPGGSTGSPSSSASGICFGDANPNGFGHGADPSGTGPRRSAAEDRRWRSDVHDRFAGRGEMGRPWRPPGHRAGRRPRDQAAV